MEFLLNITIRSLLLAAVAAVGLWVFRVKAAPARHAVWTLVTAGMLLQAALVLLRRRRCGCGSCGRFPWWSRLSVLTIRPLWLYPARRGGGRV